MQKRKIGILTFSDGRKFAHDLQYKMNKGFQDKLAKVLKATGEVECVTGEIIWTPELARAEAKKLAAAGVEATILNFAIWAFPHLPAIATEFAPGPFLCLSNVNPKAPGLVAMLAAAGSLNQVGVLHGRVSGDVEDPKVLKQVMAFLRAASAVNRLRGKTYGLFGGRSMGMYTAVPALDQWRREFGVDIEHIDQWEIVRRAETIDQKRVTKARQWLEKHCGQVAYDGKALTPETLERQIRSYHAVRELIAEWDLDFVGIKGQPELTNSFCTMDLTEAFLNDPYDWEGRRAQRARPAARGTRWSAAARRRFSSAVSLPSRPGDWKTIPEVARSARAPAAISRPSRRNRPAPGRSRPARIEKRVDLPAPFGPRRPKISPGRTSSVTSRSTSRSPKRKATPSRARRGAGGPAAASAPQRC